MNPTYVFVGKLPKSVLSGEMEAAIKQEIANQQTQFTPSVNNDPTKISVLDFSYTAAEPNCWMVFAKWQMN